MSSNLFRAKTFSCLEMLKNTVKPVLAENKPADRIVASYFKSNKKYGSKDRKFLYEVVFSFFRWLGWSKAIINSKDLEPKELFSNLNDKQLLLMVLASSLLDSLPEKDIILYWIDEFGIDRSFVREFASATGTLKLKAAVFNRFLKVIAIDKNVNISNLVPDWLHSIIPEDIDREKFIEYCQIRPPIWLRLQAKDHSEFIQELKDNNVKYAFHDSIKNAVSIIESQKSLYNYETFKKGCFEIQDIASQIIGLTAAPKAGERWWDCCAGGGGKTLQLAQIMENKGRIISSDIREYKLEDLKKRARRDGFFNIECRPWDGSLLRKKKSESFDGVLVDAPCSCSGTWRRNPDAKWLLEPSEIEEINAIQKQLIRNVVSAVKKGGVLVYATCSFFHEENLSVINGFLAENPDFKLEPFTNPLNGKLTPGYLQVYPWDADCDAMFAARLRKL
ncbi:MAG TPA: hypothetical protein DD381_07495 [Lentisphaeria bacterium]|nr:MAG: hypothetical protein A2X47_04075 [Lentisphaerae bacterium GWF2_38_69]HBM16166.1 hypothetical protein [Lentisphaeria bacterium]